MSEKNKKSFSYKGSGVDIDSASEAISLFKNKVSSTFDSNVLNDLASYAGLYKLELGQIKKPVLVSSTDGVGTKILLAKALNDFSTIGQDLVAMCVNDILCSGAKPLFFLDYIACGKLDVQKVKIIVESIAQACITAETALIGGETAEMPGAYLPDDIDLAGFAVGVIDENNIIDKEKIREGDIIIGIPSSGPHSNGFSLIRKIIEDKKIDLDLNFKNHKSIGRTLLEPTKIYVKPIKKLHAETDIKGLAHITGGGFYENINRIIPSGCNALIKKKNWEIPDIFNFLMEQGNISEHEMFRVFNMGIGMAVIADKKDSAKILDILYSAGEKPLEIGIITKGSKEVEII